jgi:hypothetical protein
VTSGHSSKSYAIAREEARQERDLAGSLRRHLLAGILFVAGCASFGPAPLDQLEFRDRAQRRSEAGLAVEVAVLSADESRRAFDTDLASRDIQPVWVQIVNDTDEAFWMVPLGIDPDYYSPFEAAYRSHSVLGGSANAAMDGYFRDRQMPSYIAPKSTDSGFVFTNLDEDAKPLEVLLVGDREIRSFSFVVPVPGLQTDRAAVDLDALYRAEDVASYDDEELRRTLRALPCCTTNARGDGQGDPLNLVIVGNEEDIYPPFFRRGWHETERIYGGSLWRTIRSFLFGARYRHSPVSPLYAFGRPQDVAFQKARQTIDQRNHLRLWLAPFRYRHRPVWIGQISRDVGVRFTPRTWNLTTHAIDPDVDEARSSLFQDLLLSQSLAALGYVGGVGAATPQSPRENLTGDPYFTDGYRAVFVLSDQPVPIDEVDFLEWETPPNR